MADYLGRKWGIIGACVVFSVGVAMQNALVWGAFIAGRFVAGLGVGMVSCLVPSTSATLFCRVGNLLPG